jgi:energy-coupling factor transport system ATP-binding protein
VPPVSATPARETDGFPARLLQARHILVRHGSVIAVRDLDLDLGSGEITALMGRNGSGKSSLLWALQGSGPRQAGSVSVVADAGGSGRKNGAGTDPARVPPAQARALVALVPQTPADLLYLETVRDELDQADAESGDTGAPPARVLLDRLAPGVPDQAHPRDLSEGQRLALVLAIQLRAAPRVVLLDEPTRGLDYAAKRALTRIVTRLAAEGRAVVIATHDVEFVARTANRVVVLADGEIVADGPAADVVVASPVFAPQVAKVLAPLPYLTVAQVSAALDRVGA